SFTTHLFTNFGDGELDSGTATGRTPIPEHTSVMFDFGGVVDGYCSDFGRTVYCGDPSAEYREIYDVMLAAHEAGRAAAVVGAHARDVNAACRGPIEAAGLGEHFRHRMGHGIGMDLHERPFPSEEDGTLLDRVHGGVAEPRHPEDLLGDHRAPDERADVDPELRDHRRERRAKSVAEDHPALGEALRPSGPEEVLAQDVEHRRSCESRVRA